MLSGVSFIPHQSVTSAVILLHGYGANGADLISLAPQLSANLPNTAFFAPNAPHQIQPNGFEWFSLDDFIPDQAATVSYALTLKTRAEKNVPEIIGYIEHLSQTHHIPPAKIILGGFSQGGLMTFLSAYALPSSLAGIMGLSAVPLAETISAPFQLPVLLTHGVSDCVVPFAAMDLTKQNLERMGQTVQTHRVLDLGHGIDDSCIHAMRLFIEKCLK